MKTRTITLLTLGGLMVLLLTMALAPPDAFSAPEYKMSVAIVDTAEVIIGDWDSPFEEPYRYSAKMPSTGEIQVKVVSYSLALISSNDNWETQQDVPWTQFTTSKDIEIPFAIIDSRTDEAHGGSPDTGVVNAYQNTLNLGKNFTNDGDNMLKVDINQTFKYGLNFSMSESHSAGVYDQYKLRAWVEGTGTAISKDATGNPMLLSNLKYDGGDWGKNGHGSLGGILGVWVSLDVLPANLDEDPNAPELPPQAVIPLLALLGGALIWIRKRINK